MNSTVIINQVIVLFLILIVGFIARKLSIVNEEVKKKLSELLLKITSPFLVIASFQFEFSRDKLINAAIVLAIGVGVHTFAILLGTVLFNRMPEGSRNVLKFITVFANCGYMGFPVLDSLFGKTGIFYGSIYVAAFNIFTWTYGVMLFSGGKKNQGSIRKALLNPGIISVAIGMVFFLFSIRLPDPIFKALDIVGSMTTPLSMIIIGALLAEADFRNILSGFAMYCGIFVRLILMPLITIGVLKLLGVTGMLLSVPAVLSGMPAAANTAIFAEMFEGDSLFASRCVAISTLLSMITIPLMVMLL